jgi:hypothetical protein
MVNVAAHASTDKIRPTSGLSRRPDEDNDAVFILNAADDGALQHLLRDMTLIVETAKLPLEQ